MARQDLLCGVPGVFHHFVGATKEALTTAKILLRGKAVVGVLMNFQSLRIVDSSSPRLFGGGAHSLLAFSGSAAFDELDHWQTTNSSAGVLSHDPMDAPCAGNAER